MEHHQGAAEAVLHEPSRTIGAFVTMGAGAAEGEWRVAAPVEVEKRLVASVERVRHGEHERLRQPAPARQRLALEVDRANARQTPAAEPLRQAHVAVAAAR